MGQPLHKKVIVMMAKAVYLYDWNLVKEAGLSSSTECFRNVECADLSEGQYPGLHVTGALS